MSRAFADVHNDPSLLFIPWESVTMRQDSMHVYGSIVKFIPVLDHVIPSYYDEMIKHIHEHDEWKAIMIHTGWGSRVEPINDVASAFPDRIFIVAHMKEDDDSYNAARIDILEKQKNVLVETSYCQHPKRIEQYITRGFGTRLLFGTDFRTIDDGSTVPWFINMVRLARIPKDAKRAILHDNAARLIARLK